MNNSILYSLKNVGKSFLVGEERIDIFKNINIEIPQGQCLAIIGASGSGKSTLLHLLGALDNPGTGQIYFEGKDLENFTPAEKASFRNRSLGFVFQFHHLLPEFTTLENVAMPGLIARLSPEQVLPEAERLLGQVGLAHRLNSKPATLSGGERQRAAIARALLLKPKVILADEPTGNLDEHTGSQVADMLLKLNRDLGTTLITVTHNSDIASRMDKALELRSGELYEKSCS